MIRNASAPNTSSCSILQHENIHIHPVTSHINEPQSRDCACLCLQPAREETEEKEKKPSSPQETSVLSPLKVTKKMKMVVCHVTLLDGNQFTCEVEVRPVSQQHIL